ncbi:MAG: hypothetical protein HFK08_02060 [Clostridia bacterium]|jgi:preprotein translocase subunit YajC|nr:hypothetical protein [Clostridia bacterium]
MNFRNLLAAPSIDQILLIVLLVAMVIVIIVLPMFTNKKRQKQINALQDSVKVGSTIKTVGGIIGKVIEIRQTSPVDKEMVIETGRDGSKTTMVFDIQAVYQVMSDAVGVYSENENQVETVNDAKAEQAEEVPAVEQKEEKSETVDTRVESEQAATVAEEKKEETVSEQVEEKKTSLTPSANSSKSKAKKSSTAKK